MVFANSMAVNAVSCWRRAFSVATLPSLTRKGRPLIQRLYRVRAYDEKATRKTLGRRPDSELASKKGRGRKPLLGKRLRRPDRRLGNFRTAEGGYKQLADDGRCGAAVGSAIVKSCLDVDVKMSGTRPQCVGQIGNVPPTQKCDSVAWPETLPNRTYKPASGCYTDWPWQRSAGMGMLNRRLVQQEAIHTSRNQTRLAGDIP